MNNVSFEEISKDERFEKVSLWFLCNRSNNDCKDFKGQRLFKFIKEENGVSAPNEKRLGFSLHFFLNLSHETRVYGTAKVASIFVLFLLLLLLPCTTGTSLSLVLPRNRMQTSFLLFERAK